MMRQKAQILYYNDTNNTHNNNNNNNNNRPYNISMPNTGKRRICKTAR